MENNEKNKMSDVISTSLDSIKSMLDGDTVVGTPIETKSGTTIVPLSKISAGFVGGGNDYTGKNNNQAGVGGSGVTVKPVGFIVISKDGDVNLLNIDNPGGTNDVGSSIQTILSKLPAFIKKIKDSLGKKKEKAEEGEESEESEESGAAPEEEE